MGARSLSHCTEVLKLFLYVKMLLLDFPGGTVVKNLRANAGDRGLIPGRPRYLGRPHVEWSSQAHEPHLLKPMDSEPVLHKRSHCREKPVYLGTREDLHAAIKMQCSQKCIKNKYIYLIVYTCQKKKKKDHCSHGLWVVSAHQLLPIMCGPICLGRVSPTWLLLTQSIKSPCWSPAWGGPLHPETSPNLL